MIPSYSSPFNLGYKAVLDIFTSKCLRIDEKVDGSQISFGLHPTMIDNRTGEREYTLQVRSKGAHLVIEAPDKMFSKAVEAIKAVQHLLAPGWTYRGEYLGKPKHNVLAYDRVPKNFIALYDVDRGDQDYLDLAALRAEAGRIGFDCVPVFTTWDGPPGFTLEDLRKLLDTPSFLGGQKVEGVVVKAYDMYGPDKKVLMAKFVAESFKEVHGAEWKKSNPTSGDVVDSIIAAYRTPARWAKAVQHLREAGRLEDAPKDIGLLFKEAPADVRRECEDEIKQMLFDLAWPKISRGVTAGLADWYKERLVERQFDLDAVGFTTDASS